MKGALASLALVLLATHASADLGPGSPAPAIGVKTWYKGDPVNELAGDKTYVVEFWATWCGPCIESIPHLTEVAHKNPDVTFVGVSIWEDDKDDNIKRFIDKMGDKMDYHVGYAGNQDGMAETWMKAASQNGIPTAFIVKNGVIQWVGHPMSIEEPLKAVKAGNFDVTKARAEFDRRAAETRKQMALNDDLMATEALFDQGKRSEAKAKLADLLAKNPQIKDTADMFRFQWLAKEDPKAWNARASALAKSKSPESIQILRGFAIRAATQTTPDAKAAKMAMDMALSAAPKNDPLTLQYAIAVYERLKMYDRAAGFADRLLTTLPDKPENAQLRQAIREKRAELRAKGKAK